MTPKRDGTLEPEEQVLADRLDGLEPPSVDRGGHSGRPAARIRR